MIHLLSATELSLPIADPILKFLIILVIMLVTPLLLNKIKVPHLLGLIIAGAIIGPHGFNLILRDSSIILSGTAGLLYIMFLAGLEIDMNDFRRNSLKSLGFGLYTFIIPMILGTLAGLYILRFNLITSILLASMFASHTLIAYPIASKLGITKDPAVGITVGGTMVTDMLALLVLTIIVGMTTGEANNTFWIRLTLSIVIFTLFVLFVFPLISRWFFKQFNDSIAQYIFVLSMVFLGAFLAEEAQMEGIIGAFLAGLALNRLIPRSSPLMNRIEFVGNAIFIPFFLISVGMLIDYHAFFENIETLFVGTVMIIVATSAKYLLLGLSHKTLRMNKDQRHLIFGLSNAQAAATLAAVLVGYNIILGTDAQGNPVRLLNESVLNGTILMILVTCTIATFTTQKAAGHIALNGQGNEPDNLKTTNRHEHILIPVSNEHTVEELINLSLAIKSPKNKDGLYALKVINSHESDESALKASRQILDKAVHTAVAADIHIQDMIRYDMNTSNAITSVICENGITDLVLGLHRHHAIPADFLGRITDGILCANGVNAFIYKPKQPISTIKRHLIVIPEHGELEAGFAAVMQKIKNMIGNTGAETLFFCSEKAEEAIKKIIGKDSGKMTFKVFDNWEDFLIIFRDTRINDCMWVLLSRKDGISYHQIMPKIPRYLNKYFQQNNFILIYPKQANMEENNPFLV